MQYAFKHWTLLFGSLFLLLAGQGAYAQCFQIESILVDACDGSNEGQNEMLTFRVGATALNTANLTATWPNNPWQGICQNSTTAAAIATINATIQGCGKLIEPTGGVLPANSKVLIITSTAFNPLAHSFVNLNDTMYVIFQCAGNTSGHFANYGSGTRTTTLSFSTPSPCSDVVTYDRGQLLNQSMMPGAQDGATVLFDPAGVATYTNNGCQAPYIPLSVDAGPNKSVCSNAALTLNATASGHYTSVLWSGGTGSFSPANSLATTYAPGPGDVGTIKLYCKAIAACGNNTVTTKDSMTVQILVAPQASAMASLSSICNGQTSVLSYSLTNAASAGTVTPTWYPQGVSTATAAATSPGNYTLSIANACGSSMATVSVSPGPTPTVAITANGPTQFCQGGNVILTGSSSSGYSWSTGATTSTISVSTTTTVTLTASNSCGSTSATQTVAVMPTLTVAVTPTNYTLCPGQTTTLSATSNGTAFDWGTATTPTLAVSNAGVYTLTVTGTCGPAMASATVSPGATPTGSIISTASTLCAGQTGLLSYNVLSNGGTTPVTINWLPGNYTTPTLSTVPGNTYTLELTNNCGTTSYTTAVDIVPIPTVAITANGPTQICYGSNVILTANSNISNLSWNTGATTPTVMVASTATMVVTASNACGSATATQTVDIFPGPSVYINPSSAIICDNQSVILNAISPGASTFNWAGIVTTASLVVSQPNTYTVTVSNNCGTSTATVLVTSDYTPQLSLNTSANIVCVGQMATLNVSGGQAPYAWSNSNATGASVTIPAGNYTVSNTNVCGTGTASITVLEDQVQAVITTTANSGFGPLDVDFGNNSTGASLYNWDFSNGYTSNDTLPFTTFNDVGDYIVSLVAVSPNGCFSTDTVHIRVIPEAPTLWAPNSFTPNDDGVNDLYAMKGFNIREFNCTILDRWGQEVYKWNDLDKGGWDGTVKGATATNGTYFYVVEARDINGKEIRKQGHIELVK